MHAYVVRRFRSVAQLLPGHVARQQESAKALWRQKETDCPNASLIYEAAQPATWRHVLEFGANRGGNLTYFLDRHPDLSVTGIDVNPVVTGPMSRYPGYRAIVDDEAALERCADDSADLVFTVSVLDHIPSRAVVIRILKQLVRIAPRVLLLEPWIAGVEGDVSGLTRGQVQRNLPSPHKPFAPHSYLWNYDLLLTRLGVRWSKQAHPLHPQSLGPFYQLYRIDGRAGVPECIEI